MKLDTVIAIDVTDYIIAWYWMTAIVREDILADVLLSDDTCTILVEAILNDEEVIILFILLL